jgi:hypothetical protein
MKTGKNLGVWLDHASAHILIFTDEAVEINVIESKFTHGAKEASLQKSESLMHNKQQHQQSEYYERLGDIIAGYDDVVLFGPTDAKVELFNLLDADKRFENITVQVMAADKMTPRQENAFVKDYFLTRQ